MRLNKILIAACLGVCALPCAAKQIDESIFKAPASTSNQAAGTFNRTVQQIETSSANSETLRKLEIANAKILEQPKNDMFYAGRAELYMDLKQFQKALDDVDQAISLRSNSAPYLELRASIKGNLLDRAGELTDLNAAIRLNHESPEPYAMKASTLALLKRYSEGLESANKAIQLAPNSGFYYFIRAEIFGHLHDVNKGLSDCNTGLALSPNDPMGLSLQAKLRALGRNVNSALREDRSTSLNP